MVYNNRFVMCVIVNGQVIPDKNGFAQIPFGTEYCLRFRNKNDRRAVVKFFIDGENVSGPGYIIPANDYVDVARHNDKDRAFKFVDLDSPEATDAGKNGDNEDKTKGTIEARFYLEKEVKLSEYLPSYPKYPVKKSGPWLPPWNQPIWMIGGHRDEQTHVTYSGTDAAIYNSLGFGGECKLRDGEPSVSLQSIKPQGRGLLSSKQVQDGCTVEGNTTGQSFSSSYINLEDDYCVCRLHLQGFVSEEKVFTHEQPQEKVYCENCGAKRGKKKAKFCSNCGTKL